VDSAKIGINHIQHGESAWKNDTTGRSIIAQQYIWAMEEWLNENPNKEISDTYGTNLGQQIKNLLGDKSPDKIRLTRLLVARLTWDWKSYGDLLQGEKYKDIELQACRIDTCHYAFPKNLDLLLKGIGEMKAVEEKEFKGCGSYNDNIKMFLENEFLDLNDMLKSMMSAGNFKKNDLVKAWLVACLIKTIKENINLTLPIMDIRYPGKQHST
jgi:hypothetical protein